MSGFKQPHEHHRSEIPFRLDDGDQSYTKLTSECLARDATYVSQACALCNVHSAQSYLNVDLLGLQTARTILYSTAPVVGLTKAPWVPSCPC